MNWLTNAPGLTGWQSSLGKSRWPANFSQFGFDNATDWPSVSGGRRLAPGVADLSVQE